MSTSPDATTTTTTTTEATPPLELGTDPDAVAVDLFSPAGHVDPYPRYARLRELAPVHQSVLGSWLLTRYDDCETLLRAPDTHKLNEAAAANPGRPGQGDHEGHPSLAMIYGSMLMTDPPRHTRLRRVASRDFTVRRVGALRAEMARLVQGFLNDLRAASGDGEPVDVMDVLAFPLPVTVIGELIGVPPADRPRFRTLVRDVAAVVEMTYTTDELERADDAACTMTDYFQDLIARRRREPADDLTSALVAGADSGPGDDGAERLSDDELVSLLTLLFTAGFETTTNLIGNGLVALLDDPAQAADLRGDPSLVPAAVEELLRFDSPIQYTPRFLTQPLRLGEVELPAGSFAFALVGAANRDPAAFPDPNRLTLSRAGRTPLSFGTGIHYCLGAALARLEAQVVFPTLLHAFPAMALADVPTRRPGLAIRGLLTLPVTL